MPGADCAILGSTDSWPTRAEVDSAPGRCHCVSPSPPPTVVTAPAAHWAIPLLCPCCCNCGAAVGFAICSIFLGTSSQFCPPLQRIFNVVFLEAKHKNSQFPHRLPDTLPCLRQLPVSLPCCFRELLTPFPPEKGIREQLMSLAQLDRLHSTETG